VNKISHLHYSILIKLLKNNKDFCLFLFLNRESVDETTKKYWQQRFQFPIWMKPVQNLPITQFHHTIYLIVDMLEDFTFLKGQCHKIFDSQFFHQSTPYRSLINRLKLFRIWHRICWDNCFESRQNHFLRCQWHRWNRKWRKWNEETMIMKWKMS
jgi:hypothetical protein